MSPNWLSLPRIAVLVVCLIESQSAYLRHIMRKNLQSILATYGDEIFLDRFNVGGAVELHGVQQFEMIARDVDIYTTATTKACCV